MNATVKVDLAHPVSAILHIELVPKVFEQQNKDMRHNSRLLGTPVHFGEHQIELRVITVLLTTMHEE